MTNTERDQLNEAMAGLIFALREELSKPMPSVRLLHQMAQRIESVHLTLTDNRYRAFPASSRPRKLYDLQVYGGTSRGPGTPRQRSSSL